MSKRSPTIANGLPPPVARRRIFASKNPSYGVEQILIRSIGISRNRGSASLPSIGPRLFRHPLIGSKHSSVSNTRETRRPGRVFSPSSSRSSLAPPPGIVRSPGTSDATFIFFHERSPNEMDCRASITLHVREWKHANFSFRPWGEG
jgi:hypothetical protein